MYPTPQPTRMNEIVLDQIPELTPALAKLQRIRMLSSLNYSVIPTKPGNSKQFAYGDKSGTRTYTENQFTKGEGIAIRTGRHPDGSFLCRIDLDNHRPGQDAHVAYQMIAAVLGSALDKCAVKCSTSGSGIDVLFKSPQSLPNNQPIYLNGGHAGEMFCIGGHVNVPETWIHGSLATLQLLTDDELDRLLTIVSMQTGSRNPTSWTARSREGQSLIKGYRAVATSPFLEADGMPRIFTGTEKKYQIAQDNWRRMQCAAKGERSNLFSGVVQSLMLLVTKDYGRTSEDKCRTVAAIAIAINPKAGDEHYDPVADTAAIIAKILHSDPYGSGKGHFKCPWWADAYSPPVQRASGRPVGDRQSKIDTFRRLLLKNSDKMSVDRIRHPGGTEVKLTVAILAKRLKVSERTIQRYLAELEANGEIIRRQVDGTGGQLRLILTSNFDRPQPHQGNPIGGVFSSDEARVATGMGDNNTTERVTETVQEGRQNSSVVADCDEVEGDHDCYNKVHREPSTETITSYVLMIRVFGMPSSGGAVVSWRHDRTNTHYHERAGQ